MKRQSSRLHRHYSRGLSMIELMVSLVIGLIVMIAIVSAYLGSAGASRMAEAQGRMNEDAQAALTILTQQLRMAGNNPKQTNYPSAAPGDPLPLSDRNPVFPAGSYILRGCDGTFSNIAGATPAADIPALICATGTNALPDSIAIRYEAEKFNTVPTSGGAATDCLGQSLTTVTGTHPVWDAATAAVNPAAPITYTVAENRFYIGTSTVIKSPSLYCKGNGGVNPQPLVENVEDMQFVYGTAPSTATTLSVGGYLSAANILSDSGLAALADDPSRWSKVMTVRICVLVRSELPVVSDAASAQYIQCDGTLNTSPPDLRLRRAYTTTVVLRNRVAS